MKYEYKLTNLKKYITFDMIKDVYTKEEMKSHLDRVLQVLDTEAKYKFQQALEENVELQQKLKHEEEMNVKIAKESVEVNGRLKEKLEETEILCKKHIAETINMQAKLDKIREIVIENSSCNNCDKKYCENCQDKQYFEILQLLEEQE